MAAEDIVEPDCVEDGPIGKAASAAMASTPEEKAAVLQAAGQRTAETLQAAGKQQASVLQTAGQRRINLTWEITQAIIAIMITAATLGVCIYIIMFAPRSDSGAFMFLSNIFFLVIGTYFQRTNHVKVGGVGKPEER
jgi:cell division septum initiation protein DivIVA